MLAPVPQAAGVSQVQPISSPRSCSRAVQKLVLPTGAPVACRIGREVRVAAAGRLVQAALEPFVEGRLARAGVERPVLPDLGRRRDREQRVAVLGGERLEPHDLTDRALAADPTYDPPAYEVRWLASGVHRIRASERR